MKKQTAVEFLLEKYKSQNGLLFPEDFKQAKEMEKEQIVKAFDDGFEEMPYKNGEHYYNENYKPE
jgi:hypothetical protein